MMLRGLIIAVLTSALMIVLARGETQQCLETSNEVNYKTEDMEGVWYPMEIVLHRNDSKIYGVPTETNCPVVTFSIHPKNKKMLFMLWNSTEGDLEYRFLQKGSRGQWQATPEQGGPRVSVLVVDKERYLILRLCGTVVHSTVVMTRQSSRSGEVIAEASAALADILKYPAHERKMLCSNSSLFSPSFLLSCLSFLLLWLRL